MSKFINWLKGGPGSGRRPGSGSAHHSEDHGKPHDSTNNIRKPGDPPYHERPSSRNPGSPRSGVRPSDLYPERYHADGSRKGKTHWLTSWAKRK